MYLFNVIGLEFLAKGHWGLKWTQAFSQCIFFVVVGILNFFINIQTGEKQHMPLFIEELWVIILLSKDTMGSLGTFSH